VVPSAWIEIPSNFFTPSCPTPVNPTTGGRFNATIGGRSTQLKAGGLWLIVPGLIRACAGAQEGRSDNGRRRLGPIRSPRIASHRRFSPKPARPACRPPIRCHTLGAGRLCGVAATGAYGSMQCNANTVVARSPQSAWKRSRTRQCASRVRRITLHLSLRG